MTSKLKTVAGNLVLIVVSLLVMLALGEVAVRALGLAPEVVYIEKGRVRLSTNPIIGYEPIPNLPSSGLDVGEVGYQGRSNSLGYRDIEHPLVKPPGLRRVAVIGDSVTMGLWINDDRQIFTEVMARRLTSNGQDIAVMNFGVAGYNTRQEVETLRTRGLAYQPDLVVLAYCLNDRWQDDGNIYGILLAEEQAKRGHAGAQAALSRARVSPLVRESALLRMVAYQVLPGLLGDGEAPEPINIGDTVNAFYGDTVSEAFADLAALAEDHGFTVLVAILPDFGRGDSNLLEADYPHADEHAAITALARQHGFAHFDLLPPLRDCKARNTSGPHLSYDRYHPNEHGSACIGEALAEVVLDTLGTLPGG